MTIFYSLKEYNNEYENLKNQFISKFNEVEEIDFINGEIVNYSLCSQIVNLPIDKVFSFFWRIDIGTDLKTFSISQEIKDFVLENHKIYCKIYEDIVTKNRLLRIDSDAEIEQSRLIFPKILAFLEGKKTEMDNQLNPNPHTVMTEIEKLKWQGTKLEFTELIMALVQSNMLNSELTQKEIFKRMKLFFNVDEFNENDKLKDIRKRTNTPTPFINTLETSLSNWIKAKD